MKLTSTAALLSTIFVSLTVHALDLDQAEKFAQLALAGLDREYPNKPADVLTTSEDVRLPKEVHPAFFGSFDWHSSVHGHWLLVRLLRLHPGMPCAAEARSRLSAHLTAKALAAEAEYFEKKENRSFERMYGWAWVLRLAAELRNWDDPNGKQWAVNLRPLEERIVELTKTYLPRLTYPIRTGVHPDTAFALGQGVDYARGVGDKEFEKILVARAREYYFGDRAYPTTFEPSGEDFFSPGLNVADLMRRVLPRDEFSKWLDGFLPGLRNGDIGGWAHPAEVSDLSDPRIVHLVGLNLSRAWTLKGIVSALEVTDPRRAVLEESERRHAEAGLRHVFSGHYEGEHWLATFAVYYQSEAARN
ncbi:MAG TPA: DUF2891 domain-containing protein [Chthoniobacteraceae bacterium]|nr:DUF2891 domain-containing protein [Chthoniobacteraceae bacterium]